MVLYFAWRYFPSGDGPGLQNQWVAAGVAAGGFDFLDVGMCVSGLEKSVPPDFLDKVKVLKHSGLWALQRYLGNRHINVAKDLIFEQNAYFLR